MTKCKSMHGAFVWMTHGACHEVTHHVDEVHIQLGTGSGHVLPRGAVLHARGRAEEEQPLSEPLRQKHKLQARQRQLLRIGMTISWNSTHMA